MARGKVVGIGLLVLSAVCGAGALWNLYLWGLGTPEQWLGGDSQALELRPERIDQRIEGAKRRLAFVREDEGNDASPRVRDAEEHLRDLQKGREEWVRRGEELVQSARWRRLRLAITFLLATGAVGWEGWRRVRNPPDAEPS